MRKRPLHPRALRVHGDEAYRGCGRGNEVVELEVGSSAARKRVVEGTPAAALVTGVSSHDRRRFAARVDAVMIPRLEAPARPTRGAHKSRSPYGSNAGTRGRSEAHLGRVHTITGSSR